MKRRITILLMVILTILGAIIATDTLLNYLDLSKSKSLGTEVEANFQIRPENFQLVATPESQEMMYLFQATPNDYYPAFFMFKNGSWMYYWPQTGDSSYVPWKTVFDIPIRMENGNVIWASAWVDEIGVWMDITIFNQNQFSA